LTGEVPDTRAYLCGAHAYVVPMRIGGGVRLKVLEAMALEVPIVSTSLGVEGIDGLDASHCIVADTPDAMAAAIVATLANPPATKPTRDFVVANYDWRVIVPRFLQAIASTANVN
jgi:glycosyltransferase involved in cell wall biosynthesis